MGKRSSMNYIIRTKLVGIVSFIFLFSNSQAQEIHGEPNVWFLALTQYQAKEKLNLGLELHARFDDYLNDEQQYLIRPFIEYFSNESVRLAFGYTYISTHPYGDYPLPRTKPEHNIWEQVTLLHDINETKVMHRFRLEHRWQGNLAANGTDGSFDVDGYDFNNRFRYRLTLNRNLNDHLFMTIFDELWVRDGDGLFYDRNWFYAGVGYRFNANIAIQPAYLYQYAQNNPTRFERHHSLQLTAFLNF